MVPRLRLLLRYGFFWLTFFVFCRAIFLFYNFKLTSNLLFGSILGTFGHGMLLDISLTGYILLFSSVVLALFFWIKISGLRVFFHILTMLLLVIFSIIIFVDIELYRNWGFRMDGTVLFYLRTPGEAMASVKVWLIILLVILATVTVYVFFRFYRWLVHPFYQTQLRASWFAAPVFLFIAAACIIPVRGGIGIAPIRSGTVYFSQQPYANHAAVNVQWHFLNSLLYMNQGKMDNYMDENQCNTIVDLMLKPEKVVAKKLLKTNRPNIVIIILESFTAKVVEPTGGMPGVTPSMNQLAKQGILFSQCYANGDRSDKGIVCILSGYPAQPNTSIIKYTEKAAKLPHLSLKLNDLGYHSAFYYGGDIDFANMKSYFITGGYQNLVTMNQFNASDMNSKWGAHDHVVFNRLAHDLEKPILPFFNVFFTLSSHEPFEVPMKSTFLGNSEESHYLNSVHYTDSCLGGFIDYAKKQNWWDSTLIILVADHGSRFPGNSSVNELNKFHIPMLWLGGALTVTDTIINEPVNQSDIPLMLCHQMDISGDDFYFSKDILAGGQPFAHYAFNNGFGYVNRNQFVIWDNASSKIIDKSTELGDTTLLQGKAFLQNVMTDFNRK